MSESAAPITMKVQRLHPSAKVPYRASESASGLDVFASTRLQARPAGVTATFRRGPCASRSAIS